MPKDRHYGVRSVGGARRTRRIQNGVRLLLAGVFLTAAVAVSLPQPEGTAVDMDDSGQAVVVFGTTEQIGILDGWEDPLESEKIEQALIEQGYFRYDVPLSFTEQDFLHTACEEVGVPYALALAVIEKESGFENIVGDDGESSGDMQVQEKWHRNRMERLGVTDLMDPFTNFRVGCDYLAELLDKYPTEEALTAYNSGLPGKNRYSKAVMRGCEKWKELVGDGISGYAG